MRVCEVIGGLADCQNGGAVCVACSAAGRCAAPMLRCRCHCWLVAGSCDPVSRVVALHSVVSLHVATK